MGHRSVAGNRGAGAVRGRSRGKVPLAALLVDDEPDDRALARRELSTRFDPLDVLEVPNAAQLERALRTGGFAGGFDVAIVDYKLRWTDGLTVLRRLKASYPGRPVIMFTASGNEEIAVEAMHAGLDDYVLKSPRHVGRLAEAVERALSASRERSRLRSLEERHRGFFDRLPVGAFRLSPDGRFVDVNAPVGRLIGPEPSELVGARLEDLFADAAAGARWREALRAGHVDRFETAITRSDGHERWVQIEAIAPRGPGQTPLFLEGVIVDVTDRRWTAEAEQLVAEIADRLAASFPARTALAEILRLALPVFGSYCRIDVGASGDGVRTVAVAYLDEALRPVVDEPDERATSSGCGQTPGAAGEARPRDMVPLVVDDLRERDLERVAPSAEQRALIKRARCRSVATVPMLARGRYLGALTVGAPRAHGVTPRHVALASRIAARAAIAIDNEQLYREAKDAVAARDEFIAIAAHELRTPLATLYGHAQLLGRAALPDDADKGRVAIERQCQRLLSLVQRMLEMSRLRVGQFELEIAPCDVGEAVATIVDRTATVVAPGRLHLDREPVPAVPADKLRIEEVVTNLIENALRYAPRDAAVEVAVRPEGRGVSVSVTDRGPGIPEDLRSRIFAPFARLPSEQHAPGLGLGLWISSEIVRRHGGHVGFRTELGRGTTFFFSLPGEAADVDDER